MKGLCRWFLIAGFLCAALSAFSQESRKESKILIVNNSSKELKRTAHRLHISIEQLKKARQALQEATDLAKKIKPFPVSQVYSLRDIWRQVNSSKAKGVIDSFIQDLRSEAANAADFMAYQRATSAALSFMQTSADSDYEKIQDMLGSWPDPPASAGDAGEQFRSSLESGMRQNLMMKLASTDPEKARALLSQSGNSGSYSYYSASGQIVQGLMKAGKKDEALAVVNQTVNDFNRHASDPQALQGYQSFAQTSVRVLGSSSADIIMSPLITQLTNQAPSGNCATGTLKTGDTSVDLSCAETGIVNMMRNFMSMPGLVNTMANSFPSLKSKLESVGGIDSISYYGNSGVTYAVKNPGASSYQVYSGGERPDNPSKLLKELKGKAESDPSFVKERLKDIAKGQQSIDMLISLATTASYDDPELASLALEVARPLLSQVEPLQTRAAILQNLVRACRQVEGEVDTALLCDGFILADQLREESEKNEASSQPMVAISGNIYRSADQLEVFLVSELSKDDSEKAINFARSIKSDTQKLAFLIQIAQSLGQQNY
jgi:hypothetical protein